MAADEYVEAAELLARKIGELGNDKEKVAAVKGAAELAGAGLQLVSSFQMPGLVSSIERVDKSINSQIRGLGSGAEQHAAITARRGLAEKISQYHQGAREQAGQESATAGGARGAEERSESAQARDACQALEYARSAGGAAGKINKLTTDPAKVAAVQEAVSLARFGWDLAEKDKGTAADRAQARAIIDKTERALRFVINGIEDPQAKRAAIQARQTLYNNGLKEYRAAKRAAGGRERAGGQESGRTERARDAEGQGEAAGASAGAQALEYARACAKLAARLPELGRDKEKVEAIQEGVGRGIVGLELAQNGRGAGVDIEEAREIIWRAQRVMNDQIQGIQGGAAKREAIQANRNLSRALTEYRQERQERRRGGGQGPGAARGDDEPER